METITEEIKTNAKVLLNKKDFTGFFNLFFNTEVFQKFITLETYTKKGIKIGVTIFNGAIVNQEYINQFIIYVDTFDVDEQTELHKESERDLTEVEILKDLQEYKVWLESIKSIINKFA